MADQALEVFHDYFNENFSEFPTTYVKKEDIEGSEYDSLLIQIPQENEEDEAKFINVIFFPQDKDTFPALQLVQFYYPVLGNIPDVTPYDVSQFINHINGMLPVGFFVRYENTIVLRQISTLPANAVEENMEMLGNAFQFVIAFGQMYSGIIQQLFEGNITFEQAIGLSQEAEEGN